MDRGKTQRGVTCCISGHRPDKLPFGWCDERAYQGLKQALRSEIIKSARCGYRYFISGMAQGVDTWAAEEVIRLRQSGFDVRLVAALSCPQQDRHWPQKARIRFSELLSKADEIHIISERYTPFCMGARNLWMVENSSRLIAVFGGGQSGTANTIRHARRFGLEIILIDPCNPV